MKTTRANKATDTQAFETECRWRVKLANGFAYAMGKSAKEAMGKASEAWGERAISAMVVEWANGEAEDESNDDE